LSALLVCADDSTGVTGTSTLQRFLYSPWRLFLVGLASWVVLRAVLDGCARLESPGLALCCTVLLVGIGFASCLLAVLDCQCPFARQWGRVLAALSCWAVIGLDCLWLF
jgi:hypothetical protein